MKFADINKRFTNLVGEYMAHGYIINSATMAGSQGEISKVDLTDGTEIIRVLIKNFNDWEENTEGVEIVIGRSTDKVAPNKADTMVTVWSSRLEILSTERYYEIGKDRKNGTYYGTEAEAKAAADLRLKRWMSHRSYQKDMELTPKAMEIAKQVVRNKLGIKRIIQSDVKISKNRNKYTVSYRGKVYSLH